MSNDLANKDKDNSSNINKTFKAKVSTTFLTCSLATVAKKVAKNILVANSKASNNRSKRGNLMKKESL
jgi:hypothetical protein